jgi:hypothetical protein
MSAVDLLPLPASVAAVASQLRGLGAEPPAAIVVADPEGEWLVRLASWGRLHRAATVVLASEPDDLMYASRLGVGGAAWLPVSTQSLADASGAAAAAVAAAPRSITCPAGDLLSGSSASGSDLGFTSPFWIAWLGIVGSVDLLATVAMELAQPPVIGCGPALVGAPDDGEPRGAIETAITARCPEVPVSCLLDAAAHDAPRRPVAELPSGRHVGWWSFASGGDAAVPRIGAGDGRLEWTPWTGGASIEEVLVPPDVADAAASVVRMPRWMTLRLGPGSPECRLGFAMAREAERVGKTLWVPGIHAESLPCVLTWPGTLWVDGPAVPPDVVDS